METTYKFDLVMCETTLTIYVDVDWGVSSVMSCYHDGNKINLNAEERNEILEMLRKRYPSYSDIFV